MGKATPKPAPVSLGTKRSCAKCSTKFYDFNKEELVCPKCSAKVSANQASQARAERKAKKEIPEEALMESEDIVVAGSDEAFESVEDLDDEEDDLVEDLESDDDEGDY